MAAASAIRMQPLTVDLLTLFRKATVVSGDVRAEKRTLGELVESPRCSALHQAFSHAVAICRPSLNVAETSTPVYGALAQMVTSRSGTEVDP